MQPPLIFEALTIGVFAVSALAAFRTRASRDRRRHVALLSLACAGGVAAASLILPIDIRLWLGHAYLVAGYWIPALLTPAGPAKAGHYVDRGNAGAVLSDPPISPFEAWLIRTDDRCRRFILGSPAWATPALEMSYLLCYVMVPVAFVFMWTNATLAGIDRFWTGVLLSGFACYGSLPWLVSRPPRHVENTAARGIGRLNVYVLGRVSHGFNTFPSGHVAVAVTAALNVMSVSAPAGALLAVIAGGIALGAVVGRYHYAIDVVFGLAIGVAASLLI